jgi:two-component system alkaline phosphatase synthesis response regulator PhoP
MRKVLMIGGKSLVPFLRGLEEDGFEVFSTMPDADPQAEDFAPDIIVLELAEDPAVIRILETAHTGNGPAVIALVDPGRLSAFDPGVGVDDFLLATASPSELSLRIRQALRRRTGVDTKNVIRCGDLEMDLSNYTVHIGGRPTDLTYKEYELLRFLATNPGRVFSREILLNKVWGYEFYGGGRTVDVHIRRLRSKIEDRHHTFIETVRNVGYRFRVLP